MGLNTEERQAVKYFTGYEVEHTVCYGMFTLFVVGTPPLEEILKEAEKFNVQQIYFGTSQSFNPVGFDDWKAWDDCIVGCLDAGYWVTLDFDVSYANHEWFHDNGWCERNKFVPMISVKLPYIQLFNYNTTLKIDDKTWGYSNPGVWTHHLPSLLDKQKYTYWDQYTEDSVVDSKQ